MERKRKEEEREFLHDISNKLVIADGMSSFVFKKLNKLKDLHTSEINLEDLDKLIKKQEKTLTSIYDMMKLVESRRDSSFVQ